MDSVRSLLNRNLKRPTVKRTMRQATARVARRPRAGGPAAA